jgi:hypothetical protein
MQRTKLAPACKNRNLIYNISLHQTIHMHVIESRRYHFDYREEDPAAVYLLEACENFQENMEVDIYRNPAACFLVNVVSCRIMETMFHNYGSAAYCDKLRQEFDRAKKETQFCLVVRVKEYDFHNRQRQEKELLGKIHKLNYVDNINSLLYHPYIFYSKVINKFKSQLEKTDRLFMLGNNPAAIQLLEKNNWLTEESHGLTHVSFWY